MSIEQKRIARGLHDHLRRLSQRIPGGNGDGFDEEMNELRAVDHRVQSNLDEFYTSSLATNMSKNRFTEVRANETTRVRLQPLKEMDPNPYINANYIDGRELFDLPFTYIATQAPLQNTILDFWQMVYENKVVFIVMLCAELESGKVKSEVYWPEKGKEMDFGFLHVVSVSETHVFDLVFRTFLLCTPHGEKRYVQHMQYIGWPDQGIPNTSAPLMEIIQTIGKSEASIQTPIIVHCSGGIGRTGVFIALHIALAQFQLERKEIDIKHIVHTLKLTRSGMVQRKDQFLFLCYAVLREMDRMILSAEKGVDLLKMRHRETASKRNALTGPEKPLMGSSFPRPELTAPLQNQHPQQQELPVYITHTGTQGIPLVRGKEFSQRGDSLFYPHRRTDLTEAEKHLLETYLRQQRTSTRQVALNPQKSGDINEKPTPVNAERMKNDNDNMIKGESTRGEKITLEEQLKEWQIRNKKMRFSTDMREKEVIRNVEGETRNAKSSRGTGSQVQKPSPTESLATERGRVQEKQSYSFLTHDEVTNSDQSNHPVSIIITPQEATTRNSDLLTYTGANGGTPGSLSHTTGSERHQPRDQQEQEQEQKQHVSQTSSQTSLRGSIKEISGAETAGREDRLQAAAADFENPDLFKRTPPPPRNAITEEELEKL
ncbi:putative tyrosine specific protein phosphatase [Trypanosoma theileri]|uniref:Putative tyrosine specific protein phosphatase n=1 Tax=Trypanosoma theileri TaxID=67003 RepID=A0A1X0P0V3_9TRYP|nr:putative tyrosine specific protein phosphatase [Trypanosoma theileri]ORC90343.1 putative tyrosine specific protein phosphatase [Trypanosoma theileri]